MGNIFVDATENQIYMTETVPRKKRGIYLQQNDLFVLEQLFLHRVLDSSSMHGLYKLFNPSVSTQVVTNRITRLIDCKLIYRREVSKQSVIYANRYCYLLAKRGYEVLEFANIIPSGKSQQDQETVRLPNEHNQFAIRAMLELTFNFYNYLDFSYCRGTEHLIYQKISLKGVVVPDYVIESANRLLCIEFDMSSEGLPQLVNKTKAYWQMYQNGHFGELQPIVIFVLKDNGTGNRATKRIQNIKAAHSQMYEQLAQLPVYVVSESDFPLIVDRLLQKQYPLKPHVHEVVQSDVLLFEQEKYNRLRGWHKNFVSTEELIDDANFIKTLKSSPSANVQYVTYRGAIKTIVYLTAEYGSVFSFLSVQRYVDILADASTRLFAQAYLPLEVQVIYPYIDNEQLAQERLGVMPRLPLTLMTEQAMLDARAAVQSAEDENMLSDAYVMKYLEVQTTFKQVWRNR